MDLTEEFTPKGGVAGNLELGPFWGKCTMMRGIPAITNLVQV